MRSLDLTNRQFGRLMALEPVRRKFKKLAWLCRCVCGNSVTVAVNDLRSEHTRSCGCYREEINQEIAGLRALKHGMSYSPEYYTWEGIIQRCYNPKTISYSRYGGRGISVCPRWKGSFEAFFKDMGKRPSPQHSIDRIKNDADYSPKNCRWATTKEQMRNQKNNCILTFNGKTLTVAEWSEFTGIRRSIIYGRLRRGWPVAEALANTP